MIDDDNNLAFLLGRIDETNRLLRAIDSRISVVVWLLAFVFLEMLFAFGPQIAANVHNFGHP